MTKPKYTPERQLYSFWKRVNKDGPIPEHCPELGNCWLWLGGVGGDLGHGYTVWNGRHEGAHRASYRIAYGDIDNNLYVLHKCDNPKCVRPDHLFLGTHRQNMHDMINKGRKNADFVNRKGEHNPNAKITNAQALEIRARYKNDILTKKLLANEYGITISGIVYIATKRNL